MVLLMLIIGIIQVGLLFWRWHALQAAAADAARCAAIGAPACLNPATQPGNTRTYAVSTAAARGLSGVTANNVTVTTGAAAQAICGATTASVVVVSLSWQVGSSTLVNLPSSLIASACFPLASG